MMFFFSDEYCRYFEIYVDILNNNMSDCNNSNSDDNILNILNILEYEYTEYEYTE